MMSLKGKKVLVTGGLGFIGSHLVDRLIELGAEVTIVDFVSQKGLNRLSNAKDSVKIFDFDISDESKLENVEPVDYIIHLAAYAVPNLCEKNPDVAFKANVSGTYNILKFAVKSKVKKFIFPSSALLYTRIPKYLPIDENHPLEITTAYNITKKLGEDLCKYFIDEFKLPVVYFRLFNSFGPKQDKDYFIPTVISQALNGKNIDIWNSEPTRDFTYVLDTIEVMIKAIESDFVGGPINVGSGKETKVGDIANHIAKRLGAKVTILNKEVSGPMRLACNNSLAYDKLGWKPKIEFEDALDMTIKWYQENKDSLK